MKPIGDAMLRKLYIIAALLIFPRFLPAQGHLPLNHDVVHEYNRILEYRNSGFHTAIKPYRTDEVNADSVYGLRKDSSVLQHLANEDLVSVKGRNASFTFNPLFDLLFAYDLQTRSSVFEAGFGAQLEAQFKEILGIGFTYREYRGDPADYLRRRIEHRMTVPGYAQAEGIGNTFLRSRDFEGYLSLEAKKVFALEGGYGRHFWGDGYRSFFLSDNAASIPYIQFSLDFWRIKYVYLFTVLKYGSYDLPTNTFDLSDLQKKYGVFHYLSIDAAKWFQFGFFEGVIWKRADSTGVRGVEWNYLNPMVFIRPVEFALGSPDNVILGFNMKFKMGDRNQLYTQLILDDLDIGSAREGKGFYRTKVAWQVGLCSYDLFRIEHLDIQSEFNLARPYVFAHKTTEQNYAHLSQSLAHPLGANFWEWLIFAKYRKDRWYAELDFQWARIGGDDPTNPDNNHNGSNIFVSDFEIVDNIPENLDFAYGNEFLQGVLQDLTTVRVTGGYLLNPELNMRLEVFVRHRVLNTPDLGLSEKSTMIGVRFRTALFNRYDDF